MKGKLGTESLYLSHLQLTKKNCRLIKKKKADNPVDKTDIFFLRKKNAWLIIIMPNILILMIEKMQIEILSDNHFCLTCLKK